jgi:hypothetical protein
VYRLLDLDCSCRKSRLERKSLLHLLVLVIKSKKSTKSLARAKITYLQNHSKSSLQAPQISTSRKGGGSECLKSARAKGLNAVRRYSSGVHRSIRFYFSAAARETSPETQIVSMLWWLRRTYLQLSLAPFPA